MNTTTFTSESVCSGHPDKICDQISDAIVDAILSQDSQAHIAVETLVAHDMIILAGEVSSHAEVTYETIARNQIKRLGYTHPEWGFSDTSPITIQIHQQSPEIAVGVNNEGAGDQGMMFGYACKETANFMPLPIELAHALTRAVDTARETNKLPYLRPDGKSQVTIGYKKGLPVSIEELALAVPHNPEVSLETVKRDLMEHVIMPLVARYNLPFDEKKMIINGTGVWHMGGPTADTGLTGRKIIVDTYGGYARVGGGAFSGKDPTKVDRSGAYAARFIAKNIVAHGLAEKAEVRLAYVIGRPQPLMQEIETYGTATVTKKDMQIFVSKLIDTSVRGILETLQLKRPLYLPTAAYGHFGRSEFPWEQIIS